MFLYNKWYIYMYIHSNTWQIFLHIFDNLNVIIFLYNEKYIYIYAVRLLIHYDVKQGGSLQWQWVHYDTKQGGSFSDYGLIFQFTL